MPAEYHQNPNYCQQVDQHIQRPDSIHTEAGFQNMNSFPQATVHGVLNTMTTRIICSFLNLITGQGYNLDTRNCNIGDESNMFFLFFMF